MKNLILKLKSKWPLISLALTAGILIALFLSRPARKPAPPAIPAIVPTPTPASPHRNTIIKFSGQPVSVPTTLPIYQNQTLPINLKQIAAAIAQNNNLISQNPASWISSDQSESVYFNEQQHQIIYGINSNLNKNAYRGSFPPDLNSAVSSAQSWVNSLLGISASPDLENINYFTYSAGESLPAAPANAEIIQISFYLTLDNYPIYYSASPVPIAIISVAQENRIVKAQLNPFEIKPVNPQNSPLYSFPELVSQLESGRGEIISAPPQIPFGQNGKPVSINITAAQIQYRLKPQNNNLEPYILFTGAADISDTLSNKVKILLPLIK